MNSGFSDFQDLINTTTSGEDLQAVQDEVKNLEEEVADNKTDIAFNTGQISVNTTAIANNLNTINFNVGAININTNSINLNTVNLQIETNRITTNQTNIGTNSTLITGNTQAVITEAGRIDTNVINIGTNLGNISTNSGNISTNSGNISTNSGNIAINTATISTNSQDITSLNNTVLLRDGSVQLDNGFTPTNSYDLVSKNYVDSHTSGNYLPLSGGTMSGSIYFGNTSNYIMRVGGSALRLESQDFFWFIINGTLYAEIGNNVFTVYEDMVFNATLNGITGLEFSTLSGITGNIQSQFNTVNNNINNNTSGVATNGNLIFVNANAIVSNTTSINNQSSDIFANTTAIASNATNIASNVTDISTNADGIIILGGNVITINSRLTTNESDIASNAVDIVSNTNDIMDLDTNKVSKSGDTMTGTLNFNYPNIYAEFGKNATNHANGSGIIDYNIASTTIHELVLRGAQSTLDTNLEKHARVDGYFEIDDGLKVVGDYGNMMGSGGVVGQNFYGKKQIWLKNTTSGGDAGWFIGNQADSATTGNDNDLYFQVQYYNGTQRLPAYIQDGRTNIQMNFTGQHRSMSDFKFAEDKVGLIVEATGRYMNLITEGEECSQITCISINDSIPVVGICEEEKSKKVFGVISAEEEKTRKWAAGNFASLYDKVEGDDRLYINSIGEGGIWVCDKNGDLENGDYICSAGVGGYGMRQDDDLLHSYTVAKITMSCNFDPQLEEVKIWENGGWRMTGEFKPAYECRTLDDGMKIALVGCTYHCG
ncbi:hypothetical protein N9W07_00625 [Alphaproteobacteria bacterium]|nr:hypothetical protein [Alphaproteobacteria bacterium]